MSVEEVIDGQRTIRTVDASDVTDKNEKIAELIAERTAKVEEIKERYPYYEKEDSSMEG